MRNRMMLGPIALTPAQHRVAELICRGLPSSEIAAALGITKRTVDFHAQDILRKAGVKNRSGLIIAIHNHNLRSQDATLRN